MTDHHAMDTDKVIDLANKWAAALSEALGKYGPDAVQLAEQIARLNAIKDIAQTIAMVVIGGLVARWSNNRIVNHIKTTKEKEGKSYTWIDNDPVVIIPCGILGAIALLMTIIGVYGLLNITTWASIYEPKIWIAMKILKI